MPLTPDSRVLQAYYRNLKEHIPVAQLCRETAAVMQEFTRALTCVRIISSHCRQERTRA